MLLVRHYAFGPLAVSFRRNTDIAHDRLSVVTDLDLRHADYLVCFKQFWLKRLE